MCLSVCVCEYVHAYIHAYVHMQVWTGHSDGRISVWSLEKRCTLLRVREKLLFMRVWVLSVCVFMCSYAHFYIRMYMHVDLI